MVLAGMLPLGLLGLPGFRKRLTNTRATLMLMLLCVLIIGGMSGCGGMKSPMRGSRHGERPSPTPTVSQVTINATSGSLTHSVVVSLTVN